MENGKYNMEIYHTQNPPEGFKFTTTTPEVKIYHLQVKDDSEQKSDEIKTMSFKLLSYKITKDNLFTSLRDALKSLDIETVIVHNDFEYNSAKTLIATRTRRGFGNTEFENDTKTYIGYKGKSLYDAPIYKITIENVDYFFPIIGAEKYLLQIIKK